MSRHKIPNSGEEARQHRDDFYEESGFRIRDYSAGLGDSVPDDASPTEGRSYQFIIKGPDRYYTTTLTIDISTGWGAVAAMLSEYELDPEEDIEDIDIRVFDDMSDT